MSDKSFGLYQKLRLIPKEINPLGYIFPVIPFSPPAPLPYDMMMLLMEVLGKANQLNHPRL